MQICKKYLSTRYCLHITVTLPELMKKSQNTIKITGKIQIAGRYQNVLKLR